MGAPDVSPSGVAFLVFTFLNLSFMQMPISDGGYVAFHVLNFVAFHVLNNFMQMRDAEMRDGGHAFQIYLAFQSLFRCGLRFRRWGRRSQLLCRWRLRWRCVNVNASVIVCLCDF